MLRFVCHTLKKFKQFRQKRLFTCDTGRQHERAKKDKNVVVLSSSVYTWRLILDENGDGATENGDGSVRPTSASSPELDPPPLSQAGERAFLKWSAGGSNWFLYIACTYGDCGLLWEYWNMIENQKNCFQCWICPCAWVGDSKRELKKIVFDLEKNCQLLGMRKTNEWSNCCRQMESEKERMINWFYLLDCDDK